MSDRLTPMTGEQIACHSRDGRLSPWAAPVTGEPGWQITTPSRRLAWPWPRSFPAEPFALTRKANGRHGCQKRS